MAENKFVISGASVKVMRSYDFCHFEVSLSSVNDGEISSVEVDELRKEAARLADKAVEQYKIAKKLTEFKDNNSWKLNRPARR